MKKKIKEYVHNIKDSIKLIYSIKKSAPILYALKSLLNAVLPYTSILLMAQIIMGLEAGSDIKSIMMIAIIGSVIIFVIRGLTVVLDKYCTECTNYCFKKFAMKKGDVALYLDYPQLFDKKTNELRNRITQSRNWGAGFYSLIQAYEKMCKNLFALITAIIIMIPLFSSASMKSQFNILHLVIFLLVASVLTTITLVYRTKSQKKANNLMDQMSKKLPLFMHFILYKKMGYKSGKDVRIFKGQKLITSYLDKGSNAAAKVSDKISYTISIGNGMNDTMNILIQGGAYIFIAIQAANGLLSIGSVIKYAGTIYQLIQALSGLVIVMAEIMVVCKRLEATLEFFNIPTVLYKGTLPVEKRDDHEYDIEFCNVSFKYPGSDEYVLRNVSFKLCIGERLAVVGMNGAGKTTMIKLLCRLYDPTEGTIYLNGIDIKKYDYNEYMTLFSVVFQDFKLFSFPVDENIATSTKVDPKKLEECLKSAGVYNAVKNKNDGIMTFIGKDFDENGVDFSGGEMQKLAIARALYKDASIIILDEPTAALDPISEFEIYSRFDTLVGNKTAIYISHRLSSCRFCHDIVVFHEGEIVQRGSHDELVRHEGSKYHEMWNAQAQYYEEESEEIAV